MRSTQSRFMWEVLQRNAFNCTFCTFCWRFFRQLIMTCFAIDNVPTKVRLMNKCHAYSVDAEASTTYIHECII